MNIHIIFQIILLLLWGYATFVTVKNKKSLPLNLFGLLILSEFLMIYIITSDIFFPLGKSIEELVWKRMEWYPLDAIIPIIFIKVVNSANKISKVIKFLNDNK